jgi:nitrogen regulatory protein PII 1
MVLIKAIIRPNKSAEVVAELLAAGYFGMTKLNVFGRGKQKGIVIGDVHYDELPKELLLLVVEEKQKDDVIRVIMKAARTGPNGNFGDGRVFVSPVLEAYTISSRQKGL